MSRSTYRRPEDGDARSGKRLYKSDCKTCHGRKGEGKSRKESPPLRGQYHEYLQRQIALFKNKERIHADDPDDETFVDYEDEDLIGHPRLHRLAGRHQTTKMPMMTTKKTKKTERRTAVPTSTQGVKANA